MESEVIAIISALSMLSAVVLSAENGVDHAFSWADCAPNEVRGTSRSADSASASQSESTSAEVSVEGELSVLGSGGGLF